MFVKRETVSIILWRND